MSNAVETFKQPFLSKVENILNKAVSITWEGCHKIYVCLDQESHKQQTECGYDMVLVGDKAEALDQLYEWFDVSCSLRFINAIECGDTFHDVIPQFDYDEEGGAVMAALEKLEWVHCAIQEVQNGNVDANDLETALGFVEDVRELHWNDALAKAEGGGV
jgi:hypothetical protein